jgi:hypothetical protein
MNFFLDRKSKIKKRKTLIREFVCLRKEVRKDIELPDEREMVLLDQMGLGSIDNFSRRVSNVEGNRRSSSWLKLEAT